MNDYRLRSILLDLKPLTDQECRDLWVSAPYPETRKLLWEIKRLQEKIAGIHGTLISHLAGQTGALSVFETYARDLLSEPAVQARWREK